MELEKNNFQIIYLLRVNIQNILHNEVLQLNNKIPNNPIKIGCYGLNYVSAPMPQFTYWNTNPQVGPLKVIRVRGGHENGTLMKGLVSLGKERDLSFFLSL